MVTLSNVNLYRAAKSGDLTYELSDGSIGDFIETGSLGLSIGRVLDGSYNHNLQEELWEDGPGYPVAPHESVTVESNEIVGTCNLELDPSLNSSLARMGIRLQNTSPVGIGTNPKNVTANLKNGPLAIYLTKGLPFVKLRPHMLDQDKYVSSDEILNLSKNSTISLWLDKRIDFCRYPTLGKLIGAYRRGDPWEPDSPQNLYRYIDIKRDCLNLPLNLKGVLKLETKACAKDKNVIMSKDLKPFRCGSEDFNLEKTTEDSKLMIEGGKCYLVNTSVLIGLKGVVGEMLEDSDVKGLKMHSTSKFMDSGCVNAPVCELLPEKTIYLDKKDNVSIKFEKVDGIVTDDKAGSKFVFQRFPRLPKWYDDSDLLLPLLAARHGAEGHPEEKKIYSWILKKLQGTRRRNSPYKLLRYDEDYKIAERMLQDLFPVEMHEKSEADTIRFLKGMLDS